MHTRQAVVGERLTAMIEAKLLITVVFMAAIQLVAYFGGRAKPRARNPGGEE